MHFRSALTRTSADALRQHGAALNTCQDILKRCDVDEKDVMLAQADLSFDLSIFDLYSLSTGATLITLSELTCNDARCWRRAIVEHGVTFWNSVPS